MKFGIEEFAFLGEIEVEGIFLDPGYTPLTKKDLEKAAEWIIGSEFAESFQEDSKTLALYFELLEAIEPAQIEKEDGTDEVLTLKVGPTGILEAVYGPVVVRTEDGGVILKVCQNKYALSFNGTSVSCGKLEGEIAFDERKTQKDGVEITYLVGVFEGFSLSQELGWQFSVLLEDSENIARTQLNGYLKAGKISSFAEHLKTGAGSSWNSLDDLAEGEYLITSIEEKESTGDNAHMGSRWLLDLEGTGQYITKGRRLHNAFAKRGTLYQSMLDQGKPLTLGIGKKSKMANGHFMVPAQVFLRAPNKKASPKTEKKETVAASVGY